MTATISNGVSASYSPAEDELGAADPTALLAESGDLKPLAERTYTNPVPYADGKSHTAPDPFVLKYRDLYYCYATDEHGILVSKREYRQSGPFWRSPEILQSLDRFAERAGRRA